MTACFLLNRYNEFKRAYTIEGDFMDIYRKNLEALNKTHPHLIHMIEDMKAEETSIVVSRSIDGELQATCRRVDGSKIVIPDSNDLSSLPEKAKRLLAQENGTKVILLLGFGLGGYPEALHENFRGDGVLIVYEAVPELFKVALKERDLTPLLSSECFKLILGEETEDISFMDTYHRKIVQKDFFILNQNGYVSLNEQAYEKFRARLIDAKRLKDTRIVTGIGRGAEWADAFMRNIAVILRTPGIIRLRNLFSGLPAIIVSAGPSVEKNFHLLWDAKGKAVIIAVDVVVPTLVPAGIIPDFIVALEANRKLFRAFEGNPLLKLCPLVCTAEVDYETMASLYPGPVFLNFSNPHPILKWLYTFWEDKGFMGQPGGSVSHMAFALAEFMGAGNIALMGQDLSFKEKLHAGDVTGLFYSDDDVERYRRKNPIVKDIFGEERYTMGQFLGFRTNFEEAIKQFTGTVVNATEGGLPIQGAKIMRLKDFIHEYCEASSVDTFKMVEELSEIPTTYDLPNLMSHIQTGIQTFKKVQKSATNIIQAVLRLKELKDDNMLKGAEAPQLIRKIGKWEKVVEDPLLTLIAPYRYRMENYMRRDDKGTENFDAIQDSLDYYGDLTKVIGMFLGRLENLIENLKKEFRIDGILSAKALHAIDGYYQAGMLHYETGMVREATKKVEKALTEFSRLADAGLQKEYWQVALKAHSLLAELYIKQHRLHEAKEILDVLDVLVNKEDIQVRGTGSDGGNIRNLLSECHEGLRVWEERQEVALERVKSSATNYGSSLESGSFYFRVGDFELAEGCYLKAIEECSLALADNHIESDAKTLHLIRLVGAYYGFAQTCLELNKQSDAIAALDSGSSNIILLHECDPDVLEEFGNLYCDLYLHVGRPAQAMYICGQLLGIVPHSVALNRRMRTMMSESDRQVSAGHA